MTPGDTSSPIKAEARLRTECVPHWLSRHSTAAPPQRFSCCEFALMWPGNAARVDRSIMCRWIGNANRHGRCPVPHPAQVLKQPLPVSRLRLLLLWIVVNSSSFQKRKRFGCKTLSRGRKGASIRLRVGLQIASNVVQPPLKMIRFHPQLRSKRSGVEKQPRPFPAAEVGTGRTCRADRWNGGAYIKN